MKRFLRVGLLVAVFWAVLGLVLPGAAQAQLVAESLLEFIGRSDQDGNAITHYGYVTHINGVDDAALFSDPVVRTEATALFTYFGTSALNARHVLANIITTATAPGTLAFYMRQTPGASFSDPHSFASGTQIASFTLRYHNVLNVQQPNALGQPTGIASAIADAELPGLRLRVTATGEGTLTQETPPKSVFFLGGNIVILEP